MNMNTVMYFSNLQAMSDEEFLQEWHSVITANDDRLAAIESTATARFGIADWRRRYADKFPDQTHYQLLPK